MDWNRFITSKEESSSKVRAKGHWARLSSVLDETEKHTLEHMLADTNQKIATSVTPTPQK